MPKRPRRRLVSDEAVAALATNRPKQDVSDHEVTGLLLRVSGTTGRKYWYVRYDDAGGRTRRMKIGEFLPERDRVPGMTRAGFPVLGLVDARLAARTQLLEVEKGEDPLGEREEARAPENTFRAVAEEVLSIRAARTRERTIRERRRLVEKEIYPVFGDRPVSEITPRDVQTLVDGIARGVGRRRPAPVLANRVHSLVRLVFNKGRRLNDSIQGNPAQDTERWPEEGRDRWLTLPELGHLWHALEDASPAICGGFRLGILTAQRMGSIFRLRWEDVDDDLWTIPKEHFKGRRRHLVPLSPEALQVLDDLRQTADSPTWVFPTRAGAKTPHLQSWANQMARVRDSLDIPHWSAHDFRTTFRTIALMAPEEGGLGAPIWVVDQVLGHKEQSLGFARYQGNQDRYLLHDKRQVLMGWGALIRRAVEAVEKR